MKLTIKTLKGEKFDVQVEEGNTVAEVKGIIVSLNLKAHIASLRFLGLARMPYSNAAMICFGCLTLLVSTRTGVSKG
jgi:hypothetical protein